MFPTKNNSINVWAAVIGLLFLLFFFVIMGRFLYIAHSKEIDNNDLTALGKQKWQQYTILDAKRGKIYSSNDQVLAEDVPSYTIQAILSKNAGKENYVTDKSKTARLLAPILDLKESYIYDQLNKPLYLVQFGKKGQNLSQEVKKKIDKLHLNGITFIEGSKRYYPNNDLAAYTIGFTSKNDKSNKQYGVLGIEQSLNKYLTEQDGSVRYYQSAGGVPIPDEKQKIKKEHNGDNVYLTIDSRIQTVLDESMSKVQAKYKPKRMVGIVADPKTGQILAMSNRPNFNLNKRDLTNFVNSPISEAIEPGSVMKIFTLASAIDAGVYHGNQTYQSGQYKVPGVTIHDWNQSWGPITFDEGFQRSSNVAFSIIADKYLGTEKLYKYFQKFGFMQKTGIDLPNESNSNVSWKWESDKVMMSFGQASAFTPIQIVQAATAVANDGKMMKPYIVSKVVDPNKDKTVIQHKPTVVGQPISKEAAEQTRDLMRQVITSKKGTGHTLYNLPGYEIIGKTGTAQLAINGKYLYGRDNYIFSFLGMAPKNDPKLIVYVSVDRPNLSGVTYDAQPVADVVNPVLSNSLQYMNIKPDAKNKVTDKVSQFTMNQYVGLETSNVSSQLQSKGFKVTTIGSGKITKQYPFKGDQILDGSRVILVGDSHQKMPDIKGWSLSDVMQLADMLSLKPQISGQGFAVEQKPSKGTSLHVGDSITIKLKSH
ncbi:penicillin-binding protein [Terrilactibacillus laevilacticus]|uniref:serine-type D-Ala-D-Ala carboxypeptidase n=1 Tax=Terrilactibacillus laevilacticus TaxID=1380157 RepID=A0ABW5PQ28_9BACI|nr:penicillin-binding protein [Terrilactibacillus laevilacticus]